ncbi:tRNA 2-thiouridine(34) synthase MnmA [uncultured Ruthenibacterium sp.]|uniref:tRNA 2-thiouridine(34) synthase MnmA n=1 Tax=uncultured Ruthenibacterium sp. TaxID=1905347 RepID=UPI00349E9A1E
MSGEVSLGSSFSTFEKQDKILVGLSGGVDSSVCIQILKEQGFDVYAVFIRFSPAHDASLQAAKAVAKQFGVPFSVEDCSDLFESEVIEPFCNAYCHGETPSPCVLCNPNVKFKVLAAAADRMGIHFIATGHYARVCEENGVFYIARAASTERDQSYMLYRLPQDILQRLCLPVGEFEKTDIREMARTLGLVSADSPDSQEICFIPDGNYAAFISERGLSDKAGRFIGPHGEDFGPHKGVSHYTIGQRKGLNIAYGQPIFVRRILDNGDIQLALAGDEFYSGICIRQVVRSDEKTFAPGEEYLVKIRSRATPSPCVVEAVGDDDMVLRFASPLRAPAPGQSAVLYLDEKVIGGGIICEIFE